MMSFISCLDYFNIPLISLSDLIFSPLQSDVHTATKLIYTKFRSDHVISSIIFNGFLLHIGSNINLYLIF